MKNEHIIELIESEPLGNIPAGELAKVREHITGCASCARAFEAIQISSVLLKERAVAGFEPSPFFQTRILAALRERQAANEWSWSRMWRSAGVLASSMLASVVAMAVLTFAMPGIQNDSEVSLAGNNYSAEEVILNQNDVPEDQVSDAQVLDTLYDADEEK
jgi:anti-sigma factor RsiW